MVEAVKVQVDHPVKVDHSEVVEVVKV
jgi:ABC-type transporter Mla MlaB component